jgi:UDP-2-acetamido-2-deoxy-ribo-hexuluronate aminotransferase
MKIPFIDITRFEEGFKRRWLEKVDAMSCAAQFIGGSEVATLERRLVERLGVGYAIGCANGTDGLQLALRALGVGAGDTVLVPNATFWATFEAVVNVGASPVTVDVTLSDGSVDLAAFEHALEKAKPKAAIIVHLYGWGSAHLIELRALCAKQDVPLLEDGAQCFGSMYCDESIFKGALISTTSFYPAKVLGAAGDGGAVFTSDKDLAERVRRLGNHGRTAHYGYGDVGWNSRLDGLQAAYLNISLDYVDARIDSRRKSAAIYREFLAAAGIKTMNAPEGYFENGYCNVCLISDLNKKARLEKLLKERAVGFANIYPGGMSAQAGAAPYLRGHYGEKNAERLCESVLNLPLFPYMTEEELNYILSVVRESGV